MSKLSERERATIQAAIEVIAAKDEYINDHPGILGKVSVRHLIVKRTYDDGEVPMGTLVFGLINAIELALRLYAHSAGITQQEAREKLLECLRAMLREESD